MSGFGLPFSEYGTVAAPNFRAWPTSADEVSGGVPHGLTIAASPGAFSSAVAESEMVQAASSHSSADQISRLPAEIRNLIYKFALAGDTAVVIQPRFEDLVPVDKAGDISEASVITSASSLHRTCKYLRSECHSILKAQALKLEVDAIIAHVIDFDFRVLIDGFLERLTSDRRCTLGHAIPFLLKLTFTDGFYGHEDDVKDFFYYCARQYGFEELYHPRPHMKPGFVVKSIQSVELQEAVAVYLNAYIAHDPHVQHTPIAEAVSEYIDQNSEDRLRALMAADEGVLDDKPGFTE